VLGWACQPGDKTSVEVRIHADAPNGQVAAVGRADTESDLGVRNACRDSDGKHRLKLPLPRLMFTKGHERKVFAEALGVPPAPRPLTGSYRHPTTHPWVFTTESEVMEFVGRINTPGSYSAMRFGQLAGQIARDLAAHNDWDAVYSGCNIGLIQYAFSY
jgi:hypothetical protein